MKLNTVWKWWDYRRVGLSIKFASQGVSVRPLPYDSLSDDEQEIVYHYWMFGELLKKEREEKLPGSRLRQATKPVLVPIPYM